MGVSTGGIEFSQDHVRNRDLILKMLKAEEQLYMSKLGQEHILNHGGLSSLDNVKTLQRQILKEFKFNPSNTSLDNYRTIIQTYYRSPDDYDQEIMSSVVYLRENRLLYYKTSKPEIRQTYIDLPVYDRGSERKLYISDLIKQAKQNGKTRLICAAFSVS